MRVSCQVEARAVKALDLNGLKTIEALVRHRTAGCSRPTDRTIRQSVKGCEIAMHFVILLPDDQ